MLTLMVNYAKKGAWIYDNYNGSNAQDVEFDDLDFHVTPEQILIIKGRYILKTFKFTEVSEDHEDFDKFEEKHIKVKKVARPFRWFMKKKDFKVLEAGWLTKKKRSPFEITSNNFEIIEVFPEMKEKK